MPLSMRTDTLEYATATISTNHDITGKVISVAVPAAGAAPTVWQPATVVGVADTGIPGAPEWTATYRVLIGPTGTFALAPGIYDWTVKLTDTPEVVVRFVDKLNISAATA